MNGGSGTGEVNIPEAPSLDQYDTFCFLLLFTVEEETMYMLVIDIATMTLENKIQLCSTGYGIEHYALYEDYMVINE